MTLLSFPRTLYMYSFPRHNKTLYIAGFSGIYKVLVVIEGTTH